MNESCIEFTAPHDVSVVTVANSAEPAMPKRHSLPSMLPPATPRWWTSGLPAASAQYAPAKPAKNRIAMAAKIAQPWRVSFTILPYVYVSRRRCAKISSSSTRLVSGVGFSFGEAEFALTNPPPLVPSSLMTSCDAIGPPVIDC